MSIKDSLTTNYVRDTQALNNSNPVSNRTIAPAPAKAHSLQSGDNFSAKPTTTSSNPFLKSNLEIEIKDKDGFANFGKADIRAKISGDLMISKEMILDQLSKIDGGEDAKFKKPYFDPVRQDFVLPGTAIDAIASIDIPIEIRFVQKNEGMAILVDSFLTRGSLYSEFKNKLLDAGIVTYEKDKHLFVKPTLGNTIDIPISKDKTRKARIEWIDSNAGNTKINIDRNGNVSVNLKKVGMIASTDVNKVNPRIEKPDVASIKFDFSLDQEMKPTAVFKGSDINANLSSENLEKLLGKQNMSFVQQTFGTSLALNITGLGGHLKVKDSGLILDANAKVNVKANDTDAHASTDLQVNLENGKPVVTASRVAAELINNQKVNADSVTYDGTKEGVNVDFTNADVDINIKEIKVKGQGSGKVTENEGDLNAEFTGNAEVATGDINVEANGTGKFSKEADGRMEGQFDGKGQVHMEGVKAKVDGTGNFARETDGQVKAQFDGEAEGKVKRDGIDVQFETGGKHDVSINQNQYDITVDRGKVSGSYDATSKPADETPADSGPSAKPKPVINAEIKNLEANDVAVYTDGMKINASASDGGVKVNIGKDVKIVSDAKISAAAVGVIVNGRANLQGTQVNINEDGSMKINAQNVDAEGSFHKNKLKIGGKLAGDLQVDVDTEGAVEVRTKDADYDANISINNNKIAVDAKGKDAYVRYQNKGDKEYIDVALDRVDGKTRFHSPKVTLNSHTIGSVKVGVVTSEPLDDIKVRTSNGSSTFGITFKEGVLNTSGRAKDVNIDVKSYTVGEDIKVWASDATATGKVKNKNGNLNVDLDTKADAVRVHVDRQENVYISTENAKTSAGMTLTKKGSDSETIRVNTDGTDFKVSVLDGSNVGVEVDNAAFDGLITPGQNGNVRIGVASTTRSPLKINVDDRDDIVTKVNVNAGNAVKGDIAVDGKIKSAFSTPTGFTVAVQDLETDTHVTTNINNLSLNGSINASGVKAGVDGKGNLELFINDKPKDTDVDVDWDGNLHGAADIKDIARGTYNVDGRTKVQVRGSNVDADFNGSINGNADVKNGLVKGAYSLDGNTKVKVQGQDVNVKTNGEFNAQMEKDTGMSGNVRIRGNEEQPIDVTLHTGETFDFDIDIPRGGHVEVANLKQHGLTDDPTVAKILDNLHNKAVKVNYYNLYVNDSGNKAGVDVVAKDISTTYGDFNVHLDISKEGPDVEIREGTLYLKPNDKLFNLVENALGKNFHINFKEAPRIDNDELKIRGEIRSKIGLIQYADFNIKAKVENNELVLDMDRAKILGLFGEGTVGKVAKWAMDKTGVGNSWIGKDQVRIKLADIVDDLTLTKGANFTSLKFRNDRIQLGFKFNSIDRKIADFASKKDLQGLNNYLKTVNFEKISGEGISTAYAAFAKGEDVEKASDLLTKTVTLFSSRETNNKTEFNRALEWISGSAEAKTKYVDDNITLAFLRKVGMRSSKGNNLLKALPTEVVKELANNLDQTLTQGGGFSIIYPDERREANYLRNLKGLPPNKGQI